MVGFYDTNKPKIYKNRKDYEIKYYGLNKENLIEYQKKYNKTNKKKITKYLRRYNARKYCEKKGIKLEDYYKKKMLIELKKKLRIIKKNLKKKLKK